jgi:3(or 17)beta-hydroxysteroid dehydrogenase
MARVADKVALITGGAGGLGSATARRLAEEGAIVVVADLDDAAGTALAKEIGGDYVRLDVTSEDQWRAAVSTVRGKHGRIDVLVNAAGIEGDVINGSIETASQQLTKSVAITGCRDGMKIRCNSVHPGVMQTRMIDSIMTQVGQQLNISREQAEEGALSKVPFGHIGEPDDVAYLIVYLASDESKYVTGSEFMVDGGWHLGQAS